MTDEYTSMLFKRSVTHLICRQPVTVTLGWIWLGLGFDTRVRGGFIGRSTPSLIVKGTEDPLTWDIICGIAPMLAVLSPSSNLWEDRWEKTVRRHSINNNINVCKTVLITLIWFHNWFVTLIIFHTTTTYLKIGAKFLGQLWQKQTCFRVQSWMQWTAAPFSVCPRASLPGSSSHLLPSLSHHPTPGISISSVFFHRKCLFQ